MRNTKPFNVANAAIPCQAPALNTTEMPYDNTKAGNITQKIIRLAKRAPKIRTVKSVARKIKGKLNAPQVECTS